MKIKQIHIKKNQVKSWIEIFKNPCPVTIETFVTGTVDINRRGTINTEHPDAGYMKDEVLNVPIKNYLVRHNELGDFLLDAGLDKSYTDDPKGGIKGDPVDEFYQNQNQNIKFQLESRKIKPKAVYLSHLHPDHIAGIRELPKNIPYFVGKGELEQYQQEKSGYFLDSVETIYEIDFSKLDEIPPLSHCADLLGDGSLWAVFTPGHSRGHCSYLINGVEGPIFLTMDACFIMDNLRLKIAPSDYTWDIEMAQNSLDMILKFLKAFPEVKVICGHE
jgi:N-acyl homoserine lactone hydrolase